MPPSTTRPLAQTAATLSGTVHDPSNAVLPGVTVTARSGETGQTRTSVTGPEGRFVIPQLAPGSYEIRAELSGFKPHVRPEVRLAVAQAQVLNITLQIGDLAIMDVVTAEIPTISTGSSELSYLVTSEQIEQIPLVWDDEKGQLVPSWKGERELEALRDAADRQWWLTPVAQRTESYWKKLEEEAWDDQQGAW